MTSIYLFQRALRLHDNLGLIKCLKESDNVLLVFCVDPRQAVKSKNKYFSHYSLGFMLESLIDLKNSISLQGSHLHVLYGQPHIVLKSIVKFNNIKSIYINKDYTPFAVKRTKELSKLCKVIQVDDYLMYPLNKTLNKQFKPYKVYTPFKKVALTLKVDKVTENTDFKKLSSAKLINKKLFDNLKDNQMKAWEILNKYAKYSEFYRPGGRNEALKRLIEIKKEQKHYDKNRNNLMYKTTNLSAYIKYGCVSIREVFRAFKGNPALVDQLIWREFYYHYYSFYDELEWNKKPKEIKTNNIIKKAPDIVKACVFQLENTGFLHNRGRMILAHYMLHELNYYWKDCDKYYANRLVDYDPIVNIGNWLWIVKQPKFKWLNFDIQQKKWDPNYNYVKTYVKTYVK